MKTIYLALIFWISFAGQAQFDALSYDFTAHATVLQTNPGSRYIYKKLFGLPLVSNIQIFAGSSGFDLNDLFATGSSFSSKVNQTLKQLKDTDFILMHYRQDLWSYGWTDDLERFKYFGLYWDFDQLTYMPVQLLKLGLNGNAPYINNTFDVKYLATQSELIQTIYYGVNKHPNPDLFFGYRFKLYSGLVQAQTVHNSGRFYTTDGQNNFYAHHLDQIDIKLQSSGYKEGADWQHDFNKLFFSGNYGPGIDLGVNYQPNSRMTVSASLLDLGFIYYTTDIHNYYIKGSYQFEGIALEFPNSYVDYWDNIKKTFKEKIKTAENKKAYLAWRPTTVYTGFKYGIGDLDHQKCENFLHPKTNYTGFIGLTGFAQYRPVKIHLGLSAFYEKKWSDHFYTKVNLTADNFSYDALGFGLLYQIGSLQLSLMADNLWGLSDLAKSHKQGLQFGLNWVK